MAKLRGATKRRHGQLLALLRSGVTDVPQLASELGISESTVRRDLARLDKTGQIQRTYGGAVAKTGFTELSFHQSRRRAINAKSAIALAAFRLVEPKTSIFLDAGTTCAALARLLAGSGYDCRVITRGLEAATILADAPKIDLVLIGGSLRKKSHGLVGPLAEIALSRSHANIAFLGADAVSSARGIGEPTVLETKIKEEAAQISDRVVVLADANKLGDLTPAWTNFNKTWTLITDANTGTEFEAAGVNVIRVSERSGR